MEFQRKYTYKLYIKDGCSHNTVAFLFVKFVKRHKTLHGFIAATC